MAQTLRIQRCADRAAVAWAAAERIRDAARSAVACGRTFTLGLSGGSTPRTLYELLALEPWASRIPWEQSVLLFGDERTVPPDDDQSNYRMVRESLLDALGDRSPELLRMRGEIEPDRAAAEYEESLRRLFPEDPFPRIDLLLLGIGDDGHTASLFPGTPALAETDRWVVANPVPQLRTTRLTLTFPALCAAREILFLITGEAKADVVAHAFGTERGSSAERYPCERVQPTEGTLDVLLDPAAARSLPS